MEQRFQCFRFVSLRPRKGALWLLVLTSLCVLWITTFDSHLKATNTGLASTFHAFLRSNGGFRTGDPADHTSMTHPPIGNDSLLAGQRKEVQFVIYTRYRSGSSFVGDLFSNHPDIFYLFEPLKLLSLQKQVSRMANCILMN